MLPLPRLVVGVVLGSFIACLGTTNDHSLPAVVAHPLVGWSSSAKSSKRRMAPIPSFLAHRRKTQLQPSSRSTKTALVLLIRGGDVPAAEIDMDDMDENRPCPCDENDPMEKRKLDYGPAPDMPAPPTETCNERANFVKYVLHHRLEYVKHGKRMKDFAKWVQSNRGNPHTILSFHGVGEDNNGNSSSGKNKNQTNISPSSPIENRPVSPADEAIVLRQLKRDPFSVDRMNLDIVSVSTNPQNCFTNIQWSQHELQTPNFIQLWIRACALCLRFAPVWSTGWLALLSSRFRKNTWYKWVSRSIASCGPAWIKWGQWSSTRNDMFPEALCDQLATLHADAPAHSWKHSQQCLESSLGLGPDTLGCVFEEFDESPLASGSIAQVHKANLCGVPVAVKIRHPRVQQLIDMDFRLMKVLASCVEVLPQLSWLRIRESVDQFSHTMAAQAYLSVEAHHLEILNYNFRRWKHVQFPTPFFATSSVIIETFEEGRIATSIIDKYDRLAAEVNNNGPDNNNVVVVEEDDNGKEVSTTESRGLLSGHDLMPLDLARFMVSIGVGMYLKMLLVDNLMHADLHPGNIMVEARHHSKYRPSSENSKALVPTMKNGSSPGSIKQEALSTLDETMDHMRITLVDAGMVAQLTDEESDTFIGLMSCLGEGDGEEAAKFALRFSLENDVPQEEQVAFTQDMKELFAERCRGYETNVDVGHVLRGILGLIRKHHVRIDANYATLVINALCVESLARRVCPSYNVLDAARPLLQGYRRLGYKKKDGTFKKSRLFNLWMAMNAFKKNIDDRFFFGKVARTKSKKKNEIVKQITG